MHAAVFQAPFLRPERSAREVFAWAVDQAVVHDEAGYTEYWIGEHATRAWESIPNPELVIAAAAGQTSRIKLAPGAHLLPYHHPASLAVQVAFLSQVLEGRYLLGIGAGAYPEDGVVRGLSTLGANHRMMAEAIDVMEQVWRGEPFQHAGEFYSAGFPEAVDGHPFRSHLGPWGGKVDIALAALHANSSSIQLAGSRGWIPLTIYLGERVMGQHWDLYRQAAMVHGRPADRSIHHVVRDVLVADTDAEAKRRAVEGGMGQAWTEYLLPAYRDLGLLPGLLVDDTMSLHDIDLEYLAEHVWLVGSPETVRDKLQTSFDRMGGWGTHLIYSHDYLDDPAPWNESVRRFAEEVAPHVMMPEGL